MHIKAAQAAKEAAEGRSHFGSICKLEFCGAYSCVTLLDCVEVRVIWAGFGVEVDGNRLKNTLLEAMISDA